MEYKNPHNAFKEALKTDQRLLGLWLAFGSATTAEISADAGFDWVLIDGEHGPNDLTTILAQLRALYGYPISPIVRPANSDPVLIKQVLDLGAQTLLLPMVNTREQAEAMVRATRYAPEGIRGVGGAIARSGRWGRIPNYMRVAADDLCVLVQVESRQALENIDEIASVDGIDGVFIGPADLSASLGHPDDAANADVQESIHHAFDVIASHGKAIGSLAFDTDLAKKYFEWGANFIAVAGDTDLYVHALEDEVRKFR
ncbi:HpcH/HpaI aldolase/citrate lyase family protein [Bifidobacterium sp. ESL0745]|uniref:HpcH/HpaI aldolase family protein n=1 Tax=Bifidobacterium sp. ESL0745 TaxID=2983226 RepID=UPI0023F942F9|nr:HpcH/HpaI aldolase/citrate lyase family protein [Bifidobacterium sp. ESL0745]MDF7665598.1 HpcH/HpaI aldolase/citrate lyase family protein [Bifidobacterium sp. ESL0745]